jgi:hypothetical protein
MRCIPRRQLRHARMVVLASVRRQDTKHSTDTLYQTMDELSNRAVTLILQRHFALLGSAASVLGTLQRGLIIFATY